MARQITESLVEVVLMMAQSTERTAQELRSIAKKMHEEDDPTYASEAVNTMLSLNNNTRMDLLITRTLRHIKK